MMSADQEPNPVRPDVSGPSSTAVADLYREHACWVGRVLRLRGVDRASVEDALQDVFLVAFRRFGDFTPRASHRAWLYGIALRVARDYRRRRLRKGGLLELDERRIACSKPDPCTSAFTRQALFVLRCRLGEMDEARRRVFILSEVEGMTAPEIAETLSVKLNTVYSRLRAARQEVGQGLSSCLFIPPRAARRRESRRNLRGSPESLEKRGLTRLGCSS